MSDADGTKATGPWDVTEVDGPDGRLDFGSLWVRGVDGLQVQAQVDEASGAVSVVTLTHGQGGLQLQAFAAPRTGGLWEEVRGKLRSSVTGQGGVIEEAQGEHGVELRGKVPGQGALQPVRFVGVDGPRWFLRGLFLGAAAEPGGSPELEQVFRDIVVVRGGDAMPMGEALAMRLPQMDPGASDQGASPAT
ncbi:MAG: hypothetical protein RL347_1706 [Actinomycetota bacterium]|jgi:hypothetical protein